MYSMVLCDRQTNLHRTKQHEKNKTILTSRFNIFERLVFKFEVLNILFSVELCKPFCNVSKLQHKQIFNFQNGPVTKVPKVNNNLKILFVLQYL